MTQTAFASTWLLAKNWNGLSTGHAWPESTQHGAWTLSWNGYGTVGVYNTTGYNGRIQPTLLEIPASADSSAMVTSISSFGDHWLDTWSETHAVLRVPIPNAWERAWTTWHGNDVVSNGSIFHEFYYFIQKAGGWELGKTDSAYSGGQRFLATGTSPTWGLGQWSHLSVASHRVNNGEAIAVYVYINGQSTLITSFTDTERPYFSGHVGLYDEGAVALWGPVTVRAW